VSTGIERFLAEQAKQNQQPQLSGIDKFLAEQAKKQKEDEEKSWFDKWWEGSPYKKGSKQLVEIVDAQSKVFQKPMDQVGEELRTTFLPDLGRAFKTAFTDMGKTALDIAKFATDPTFAMKSTANQAPLVKSYLDKGGEKLSALANNPVKETLKSLGDVSGFIANLPGHLAQSFIGAPLTALTGVSSEGYVDPHERARAAKETLANIAMIGTIGPLTRATTRGITPRIAGSVILQCPCQPGGVS